MLEEHTCYQVDKLIDTNEVFLGKEDDRIFINFPSINGRDTFYYYYDKAFNTYTFDLSSYEDDYKGIDLTDYLVERLNVSYQDSEDIEQYFINLAEKTKVKRTSLEIAPVPCDEECQQVGTENYDQDLAYKESMAFLKQLERTFPKVGGAYLKVKSYPHDFGNYYEVVAFFDEMNDEECEWAFNMEGSVPLKWDDEALLFLNKGAGPLMDPPVKFE